MVQFITSNPAIDGFQKAETHRVQTEAGDLTNQFNRQSMPDRLKQQAGYANTADAQGQVAQATIGDNIAQEGIQTQQARANLRSTSMLNDEREWQMTTEALKLYEQGLTTEGDARFKALGVDPNKPEIQLLKTDREYRGVTLRAIEDASKQMGNAETRQKAIETRIESWRKAKEAQQQGATPQGPGTGAANDFGHTYSSDPSYPPRDTTQQIGYVRGFGTSGSGRRLSWEAKRDALIQGGYDPKDALDYATGVRKPPDDMKIRNLIERQVETERRGGFLDDTQIQTRRAELLQEFGITGAGAPAPNPATAPKVMPPGTTQTVPNPVNPTPQASAAPAAPQMPGYDFNFITQGGAGGVNTQGYLPNGGNPEAMRQGLQRQGQSLLSTVDVPTDPTSGQGISASQAATAPSGGVPTVQENGRIVYVPRTRQEAESLPSGAWIKDPKGNTFQKK